MSIYENYTNDELIAIRNLLKTKEARLLVHLLDDFKDELATKPIDASELKGMARLLHKVKTLSKEIEGVVENKKG